MQEILKNQATASLLRVYFDAVDGTAPTTPLSSTDMDIGATGSFTVKISKNGGATATPTGAAITQVSSADAKGLFYVQLATADVDTGGILAINIKSSGGPKNMVPRRILVRIKSIDDQVTIGAAVLTAVTYGTHTVKGALTRMDRFLVGKATGLKGAVAAFFAEDGVTKVIEAAQDVNAGTRTAATTVGGD